MPNAEPATTPPKVTAMVLTLNEEHRLSACLDLLTWADEILVVDSFSSDRTPEIAAAAGARVVQHEFGGYASQINWGLSQASGDWVLMVDADELVTPELRDSVKKTLAGRPEHEIYSVVRDAYFLGRPMWASSWSNDRIPRLFRRGSAAFAGTVHPMLEPGARNIGLLRGRLLHHTYESIEHYFDKIQKYTSFGARDAYAAGKRSSIPVVFLSAMWRFFHNYFIRGEIFDGKMGLLSSGLAATYTFMKYAKLWGLADSERPRRTAEREWN